MTKNDKKLHIFNFAQNIKIIKILDMRGLIELYNNFNTPYIYFFNLKKLLKNIDLYHKNHEKKLQNSVLFIYISFFS